MKRVTLTMLFMAAILLQGRAQQITIDNVNIKETFHHAKFDPTDDGIINVGSTGTAANGDILPVKPNDDFLFFHQ